MPGEHIQIDGLRQLSKALRDIEPEARDELKVINREGAAEVLTVAEQLVPRRSGSLARSLRTGATLKSGTVKAGKASVPYAGAVHFGWPRRHIAPQPFLWDALDRRRDEIAELYTKRLQKLVDRVFADGAA